MGGFILTSKQLEACGKGLWTLEGLLGGSLSTFPVRMTIIQIDERALLLVSSFPPTPEVMMLLRPLGQVKLVLAPNSVHCLWGAQMRDACLDSLLAGPPKAAERFPDSRWDAIVTTAHDIDTLLSQSGLSAGSKDLRVWTTIEANPWLQEIVLVHHPSKTLVLTDLAFNFKRKGGVTPLPGGPLGVIMRHTYLNLAGGYRTCCPTKPVGWLLRDADALCAVVDEILSCDFDQVVVAHGDMEPAPGGKKAFTDGAAAFFKQLAQRRARRQQGIGLPRSLVMAAAVAGAAVVVGLWWRSQ